MASANTVYARSRGNRCWAEISLRITFALFCHRHAAADDPAASILDADVAGVAAMGVFPVSDLRQTQTCNVLGHEIQSAKPNLLQMQRLWRAIVALPW